MSALYLLHCDACGADAKEVSVKSIASARRMNRPAGWSSPKRGVDYCPTCTKARPSDPRFEGKRVELLPRELRRWRPTE